MKRLSMLFCLLPALGSNSLDALAATWPKISNSTPVQCTEALQIAKAMFDSDAVYLYAPPTIPENFPSILALKPQTLDISGGDALEADAAVFEKLSRVGDGSPKNIYWQKTATNGQRAVLLETPRGWRGDQYSLFVGGEESRSDEFLSEIRGGGPPRKFASIIPESWRPPLIFQEKLSGQIWFVDVGHPAQFLSDWHIHVGEPSGVTLSCVVQFRPSVERAVILLPKPVRELARLLDRTMGKGESWGTLQPTARLRNTVEHAWANAAQRPWVSDTPYNSREEVDAGLKNWSQTGSADRKIYQAIQRQYPVAERSLANYYQQHFGRSTSEAKELSAYFLDIVLRKHYTFHSEDRKSDSIDSTARKSPWSKAGS